MNKNMNSYELVETYPGSPKLGTIVVDTNINNGAKDGYFSENWGKPNGRLAFTIGIQHDCENNPKFWRKLENKILLTKDTVKEGQKVYRIWRNGEKSLGVITKPDFMMFEALEDYPGEGQITKGYNYGLGDYKYELVEEVIEKDYEILEIHYKSDKEDTIVEYSNGIAVKRNDNISIKNTCTLKEFNKTDWEKYITITKVKRLLDNQIFKLGDKVQLISSNWKNQDTILTEIRIENNLVIFRITQNKFESFYRQGIQDWRKTKLPLFKTFDGVDIFEGDRVYTVTPNFCIGYSGSLKYKPIQPCFSTREKAEEYIKINKPILTRKDIIDVYNRTYDIFAYRGELEKLIDKKLNL
jgi:hypothetical protein